MFGVWPVLKFFLLATAFEPDQDGDRNQDQASIGCTDNFELHTVDTNVEKSNKEIGQEESSGFWDYRF